MRSSSWTPPPLPAACGGCSTTRTATPFLEHIDKVLGETLGVSHVELARLRLIGNPNLGPDTTPADVAEGARQLVDMVGPYKPVDFLCVQDRLCQALPEELPCPVLPIKLYLTYPWISGQEAINQ